MTINFSGLRFFTSLESSFLHPSFFSSPDDAVQQAQGPVQSEELAALTEIQ
jgi:hypothetical protein